MSDNVKDPKELLMEGETGDSARIRAMEQEKQAAINEEIAEATSVKGQYSASQIRKLSTPSEARNRTAFQKRHRAWKPYASGRACTSAAYPPGACIIWCPK